MYGRLGIHLGEEDGVAGRQRRHRILPFASGRQVKRNRCSGWRIKHVGGHWGVVGGVVAAGALIRSDEQRRPPHLSRFRVHEILCLGHHTRYRGSRGGEHPHMGKYRARQPAGESRCRIRIGRRWQILAQGGCHEARQVRISKHRCGRRAVRRVSRRSAPDRRGGQGKIRGGEGSGSGGV